MASLSDLYIKKETLQTLLNVLEKKGENGVSITVSINDESREFDGKNGKVYQNVSAFVSQTKEQREAKKDKFYVGNGKCFWTDGTIVVGGASSTDSKSESNSSNSEEDDLPW